MAISRDEYLQRVAAGYASRTAKPEQEAAPSTVEVEKPVKKTSRRKKKDTDTEE
jgi:hypothetical protein